MANGAMEQAKTERHSQRISKRGILQNQNAKLNFGSLSPWILWFAGSILVFMHLNVYQLKHISL
jgi:hypothetical protein